MVQDISRGDGQRCGRSRTPRSESIRFKSAPQRLAIPSSSWTRPDKESNQQGSVPTTVNMAPEKSRSSKVAKVPVQVTIDQYFCKKAADPSASFEQRDDGDGTNEPRQQTQQLDTLSSSSSSVRIFPLPISEYDKSRIKVSKERAEVPPRQPSPSKSTRSQATGYEFSQALSSSVNMVPQHDGTIQYSPRTSSPTSASEASRDIIMFAEQRLSSSASARSSLSSSSQSSRTATLPLSVRSESQSQRIKTDCGREQDMVPRTLVPRQDDTIQSSPRASSPTSTSEAIRDVTMLAQPCLKKGKYFARRKPASSSSTYVRSSSSQSSRAPTAPPSVWSETESQSIKMYGGEQEDPMPGPTANISERATVADATDVDKSAPDSFQRKLIAAPAGSCGVILHNTPQGPAVQSIKGTSPLFNQLSVGDRVVEVDGADVTNLRASKITKILMAGASRERRIVVLSKQTARQVSSVTSNDCNDGSDTRAAANMRQESSRSIEEITSDDDIDRYLAICESTDEVLNAGKSTNNQSSSASRASRATARAGNTRMHKKMRERLEEKSAPDVLEVAVASSGDKGIQEDKRSEPARDIPETPQPIRESRNAKSVSARSSSKLGRDAPHCGVSLPADKQKYKESSWARRLREREASRPASKCDESVEMHVVPSTNSDVSSLSGSLEFSRFIEVDRPVVQTSRQQKATRPEDMNHALPPLSPINENTAANTRARDTATMPKYQDLSSEALIAELEQRLAIYKAASKETKHEAGRQGQSTRYLNAESSQSGFDIFVGDNSASSLALSSLTPSHMGDSYTNWSTDKEFKAEELSRMAGSSQGSALKNKSAAISNNSRNNCDDNSRSSSVSTSSKNNDRDTPPINAASSQVSSKTLSPSPSVSASANTPTINNKLQSEKKDDSIRWAEVAVLAASSVITYGGGEEMAQTAADAVLSLWKDSYDSDSECRKIIASAVSLAILDSGGSPSCAAATAAAILELNTSTNTILKEDGSVYEQKTPTLVPASDVQKKPTFERSGKSHISSTPTTVQPSSVVPLPDNPAGMSYGQSATQVIIKPQLKPLAQDMSTVWSAATPIRSPVSPPMTPSDRYMYNANDDRYSYDESAKEYTFQAGGRNFSMCTLRNRALIVAEADDEVEMFFPSNDFAVECDDDSLGSMSTTYSVRKGKPMNRATRTIQVKATPALNEAMANETRSYRSKANKPASIVDRWRAARRKQRAKAKSRRGLETSSSSYEV